MYYTEQVNSESVLILEVIVLGFTRFSRVQQARIIFFINLFKADENLSTIHVEDSGVLFLHNS